MRRAFRAGIEVSKWWQQKAAAPVPRLLGGQARQDLPAGLAGLARADPRQHGCRGPGGSAWAMVPAARCALGETPGALYIVVSRSPSGIETRSDAAAIVPLRSFVKR